MSLNFRIPERQDARHRAGHRAPRAIFRAALGAAAGFAAIVSLTLALPGLDLRQAGSAAAQDTGGQILWKPVDQAQLRLDEKAPLKWNVYLPDKKKDKKLASELILVLLGHRYLMLDTKARLVYVVPLAELHAQGDDFESGDLAQPNNQIPSTDWTQRDVGPAELYRLTLGDYNRVMEVSLPHPPDLRAFY
jgi:hypothetical protein